MKETGTYMHRNQRKKVEELQLDCRNIKSRLGFVYADMVFVKKMLNSYIFEPNTPNLFERLQDYSQRLKQHKTHLGEIRLKISNHERNLGGTMECADNAFDRVFYLEHEILTSEAESFMADFQELKAEIFNYAGGILKKRKSTQ